MPDYDLTRLGSRAFEQLIVSLGRSELGPGMQVFGDGRDGGREATFEGSINWAATVLGARGADRAEDAPACDANPGAAASSVALLEGSGSAIDNGHDDLWRGYTVVQAKYRLKPSAKPHDNAVWLQGQIKKEIDNWVKAAKEHTRPRLPDYLIFVTNVDLSAVAKAGGVDTLVAFTDALLGFDSEARKAGVHIRAFKIWHGDQVRAMIDAHQDIRWAFDGLLTIGDLLAALSARLPTPLGVHRVEDPLREDLVAGLAADRWIRLGQAGGPGEAKLHLDDVAIDVPAAVTASLPNMSARLDTAALHAATMQVHVSKPVGRPGEGTVGRVRVRFSRTVRAVQHVLERGDSVLSVRQPQRVGPPGLVLVGGPGQGKTTLSQLVTQAYRAALLGDADIAPPARAQVEGTRAALERMGLSLPHNRRWPVRVDLAKYAEELATGAETSLLNWVARLVSRRTSVEVTASQLNSWLGVSSWVVVLDGLDEVPSLNARLAVYEQIEQFWTRVDDRGADVLMVVTTRPTGYDERLPEDRFEHLHLQQLPAADSAELADRLSAKRFEDDVSMRAEVAARMRNAAGDTTTARLMGTPLQVTIMSMIVEKYPTLPPDRYTLFNLYYETVLEREIGKRIAISRFLADYRHHIDRLHERVGLALQVQAEGADGAEAVLPTDELRSLAHDHLLERGFDQQKSAEVTERLVSAALNRLVLLVPRDAGLGFEIRTLQELMAARAIAAGTDEQSVAAVEILADSPHWRNTWLLSAGKMLVSSDRFERRLVELLRSLGHSAPQALRTSTAPDLAADMLADGLAQHRPGFERALVQVLLSARDGAPIGQLRPVAGALNSLMDAGYREIIFNNLGGSPGPNQRATAAALLDAMDELLGVEQAGPRQSIKLVRERLSLSRAEERALAAFMALAHPPTTAVSRRPARAIDDAAAGDGALTGPEQSALATLLDGLATLDPDGTITQPLGHGLAVLDPVRFRLTKSEPPLAVLTSSPGGDPSPLLAMLANEEHACALELTLGGLPAGYWALSALVARTIHLGLSRRRVGGDLTRLLSGRT